MKCGFHCCRVIDILLLVSLFFQCSAAPWIRTPAPHSHSNNTGHTMTRSGKCLLLLLMIFGLLCLWAWEVKRDPPLRLTPHDVVSTGDGFQQGQNNQNKKYCWQGQELLNLCLEENLNHVTTKFWVKVLFPYPWEHITSQLLMIHRVSNLIEGSYLKTKKAAACKNWPPFKITLKTNWGERWELLTVAAGRSLASVDISVSQHWHQNVNIAVGVFVLAVTHTSTLMLQCKESQQ